MDKKSLEYGACFGVSALQGGQREHEACVSKGLEWRQMDCRKKIIAKKY